MHTTNKRVIDTMVLVTLYQRSVERNLPIRWTLNHGVLLAFYFSDPVNNLIKIVWFTGVPYPQPHSHPIDLSQPETVLRRDIENLVAQLKRSDGGYCEVSESVNY